jgi:hypothetical protein
MTTAGGRLPHRAGPGGQADQPEEKSMRKLFLAAFAAAALTVSGGAFAQSHQGGYLGLNPAGQLATATAPSGVPGSHQGGYLGLNAGGDLKPLPPAAEASAEAAQAPHAWCTSSTEPSRCRANAEREHASCMSTSPNNYAACRFALDKMHN